MCCRVHGHDHPDTKWVKEQFEHRKVRQVGIEQNDDIKIYHFLGYTDSSRKRCSVKGPLEVPRNELFEKTMVIDTKCTILTHGTPVICHSLVKANHLNGKLGDLRKLDNSSGRCVVHFEEKGIKPCLVKMENLRIVLDLTDGELDSFAALSI